MKGRNEMFYYYLNHRSSEQFAKSLLYGAYEHQIYCDLRKLAKEKGYERFKYLDPIQYFVFEIEREDESYPFIIAPGNMENCYKWSPDYSRLERRAIMLTAAIINDMYAQVVRAVRYEQQEQETANK
jgi:hypothetical protein